MKKKQNPKIYLNLKENFFKIKHVLSSQPLNTNKLDAALGDLRFSRKQIEKHAKRRTRKILLYAIDTLFEIIKEGNREKIFDFIDLIHNMPEIALKKRTFRSFASEINAFNNKYEEFCFSDINTIHVQISKETIQKSINKTGISVLLIGGITAFLLPFILSIIYIGKLNNERDFSGFGILAVLAALTVSVGLANIVFSLAFQYHGQKFSIITLSVGGSALAFSFFMIKNPQLYDPAVSIFCFASLIMMGLPAISYFLFRGSVEIWIKRKKRLRKSRYRNLLKGKKNYWWYEALHKEVNLGFIYHLNKIFTALFALTFELTLLLGLIKEMSLLLCIIHVSLYTLSAIMMAFSRIQENLDFHGTPIVIWRKSRNGGVDSIILDAMMVIMSFAPAYAVLVMTADIWGFSLSIL